MQNINDVLKQTIKIVKSFDHPITREEIEMYGLDMFIHSINTKCNSDVDSLFDFGRFLFSEKYKEVGLLKVSYKLLWYFHNDGNIRFDANITEEEVFQQSTVKNFYDLEPDIGVNMKELISLLEHLWQH